MKMKTKKKKKRQKRNISWEKEKAEEEQEEWPPLVKQPPPTEQLNCENKCLCQNKQKLRALIYETIKQIENEPVTVKFKKLYKDVRLPERATPGSACHDVFAPHEQTFYPGDEIQFFLGFKVIIPKGKKLVFYNRSGFAIIKDMVVKGQPTTIDSDFRGVVSIYIKNEGKDKYFLKKNGAMAQCCLVDVKDIDWQEVSEITDTDDGSTRGSGGFGSTGM